MRDRMGGTLILGDLSEIIYELRRVVAGLNQLAGIQPGQVQAFASAQAQAISVVPLPTQMFPSLVEEKRAAGQDLLQPDAIIEQAGTVGVIFKADTAVLLSTRLFPGQNYGALNGGSPLAPNVWYSFGLPVVPNMAMNFRIDTDARISLTAIHVRVD